MAEPETPHPTLRQQLIEALGLPAETFLLELLLSDTLSVMVRCHYYPTPEAMQRAVVALAEYQIVARPRGEDTAGEETSDALSDDRPDAK